MNVWPKSEFYLDLLQAYIDGRDIPLLTRTLAKKINRPVLLTDHNHRILAYHHPLGTEWKGEYFPLSISKDTDEYSKLIQPEKIVFYQGTKETEAAPLAYCLLPLCSTKRCWGYCVVLGALELTADEKRYVWEAGMVFLLAIKNHYRYQKEQEQYQDEFVRDILYNNYDSQAIIQEKARMWNWDLSNVLAVAVFEMDKRQVSKAREILIHQIPKKRRPPVFAVLHDQLVAIMPLEGKDKKITSK